MSNVNEQRYAVLIASSKFLNDPKLVPLRCPENDVDGLSEIFTSESLGEFNEVRVLKNRNHYEILEEVSQIFDIAKRNDLVLIYFSGHGKQDSEGHLYLTATNTKTNTSNTLSTSSIPVDSIRKIIKHSSCKKVIFILDCCYSGAVEGVFLRGGADEQLKKVTESRGTYILTASTGIQGAIEREGDNYGLLTKHIIEGISSGAADNNENGFIDMAELFDYVYEKVTSR